MATVQNQLIARLPRKEREALLACCKSVPLTVHEVVCSGDRPFEHLYFPVEGFISLVALVDGKPALEVGLVGREGMVGAPLALGVTREPWHAVVQGTGVAWRIDSAAFRREIDRCPGLQRTTHRYLHFSMTQLIASAGCLRFHRITQRLARWLLMTHDRAYADRFPITQEFLSLMLGVRRVSITTAAVALQRSGLIEYNRGNVTVLDRTGLEAAACACYGADRRAYAELTQ